MSSLGSDADLDQPAGIAGAPPDPTATREEAEVPVSRGRMLAVLGGLFAGLVSFGVGEMIYNVISPEHVLQIDTMTGQKKMAPSIDTMIMAAARNSALAFGALGLCLGGFLGVAGGLTRRSRTGTITGGLFGVVLGFVLGAGLARALVPPFAKLQYKYGENDLIVAMSMHGLIWGLVGASAGLAFAVGLGQRRLIGRGLMGGLVGAALGAAAFEMVGAVFFTPANTNFPISDTWPTRLMARLVVTIGTAIALALLLFEPREAVTPHQADAAAPSHQQ